MDTTENILERPLPRAAAQGGIRLALAATGVAAPILAYAALDSPTWAAPAVAACIAFGLSLWARARLREPGSSAGDVVVVTLTAALVAAAALVVGGYGTVIVMFLGEFCGPNDDAAWVTGFSVAGVLYAGLSQWALRGDRLRPLWAWPLAVLVSIGLGLVAVALFPGSIGTCSGWD